MLDCVRAVRVIRSDDAHASSRYNLYDARGEVGAASDGLGYSVAVSSDGVTIVAGALDKNSFQGAVYVFGPQSTATDVTGVKATVNKKGQAVVQWHTLSEARISGFNIYRKTSKGEWKQINAQFKQAKYAGQPLGSTYRYTDKTVKAGKTYRFKVEILYLDGHKEFTEMVRVKVK